jgi:hypothetical protein
MLHMKQVFAFMRAKDASTEVPTNIITIFRPSLTSLHFASSCGQPADSSFAVPRPPGGIAIKTVVHSLPRPPQCLIPTQPTTCIFAYVFMPATNSQHGAGHFPQTQAAASEYYGAIHSNVTVNGGHTVIPPHGYMLSSLHQTRLVRPIRPHLWTGSHRTNLADHHGQTIAAGE